MNNDMSIPMGISRLGFLVSWAAVLTAKSKPKNGKNHDGCSAQYARPTEFSQCPVLAGM